jgi:hypothetical protein
MTSCAIVPHPSSNTLSISQSRASTLADSSAPPNDSQSFSLLEDPSVESQYVVLLWLPSFEVLIYSLDRLAQ